MSLYIKIQLIWRSKQFPRIGLNKRMSLFDAQTFRRMPRHQENLLSPTRPASQVSVVVAVVKVNGVAAAFADVEEVALDDQASSNSAKGLHNEKCLPDQRPFREPSFMSHFL